MDIKDNNFDSSVSSGIFIVDFWAEWCGPCKMVSPILEDVEKDTGVKVLKLNVDENPIKTSQYSVSSIPTMMLFKDGIPVKTIIGAKPKAIIIKEISEWI